jgi:hypothetical protein
MKIYIVPLTFLSLLYLSCSHQSTNNIKLIREFKSERSASKGGHYFKESNCFKDLHFDKNGNRILELQYLPPCDSFAKLIYSYDDKNLLVQKDEYSTKKFIGRTAYKNDSLGRVIESLDFDNNVDITAKTTYEYDINGRLQTEKRYQEPENSLWTTTTYSYDSIGNMLETLTMRFDGLFYAKLSYKYDKKGNKTEEIMYQDSTVVRHRMNFKYNDKGIVIAETLSGLGGHFDYDIEVIEITYDKMGNWLKKICRNGDATYYIVSREIEYY